MTGGGGLWRGRGVGANQFEDTVRSAHRFLKRVEPLIQVLDSDLHVGEVRLDICALEPAMLIIDHIRNPSTPTAPRRPTMLAIDCPFMRCQSRQRC